MNKTELCLLAEKYKTDKCILYRHNYTPYYNEFLSPYKDTYTHVLELGVGFPGEPGSGVMEHVAKLGYEKGGSLRMWRDFFVHAEVWGFDNHPNAIFQDTRIHTFLVDQTDKDSIQNICSKSQFDFILDDGGHIYNDQIKSFEILEPFLKKDGIYIIEDLNPEYWTPEAIQVFLDMVRNTLNFSNAVLYDIRKDTNFLVNDDLFLYLKK
jgi:hypothetical protein